MTDAAVGGREHILVGIDGSDSARHAAIWAAHEAQRRNLTLKLVFVLSPRISRGPGYGLSSEFFETVRDSARTSLAEASEAVAKAVPEMEVTTELFEDTPITTLVELSKRARLAVVGSRGLGGFSGMLTGSTAVSLAAHGHCPVVVVRGTRPDEGPPTSGPVVVGVDSAGVSREAVGLAFEAASLLGVNLIAVHTFHDFGLETLPAAYRDRVDWQDVQTRQREVLAEAVAGYQEKFPDVTVEQVLAWDRPVQQLLKHAENAQLLVVGSHGHGELTGLLFSSTSQPLIYHAPCPVLVVRPEVVH